MKPRAAWPVLAKKAKEKCDQIQVEVVKALNALGATPQDLLAILQAIKSAGALNAELEVI